MSNELDLAHAALRHYGLSAASLSRLGGTDNINFKVRQNDKTMYFVCAKQSATLEFV